MKRRGWLRTLLSTLTDDFHSFTPPRLPPPHFPIFYVFFSRLLARAATCSVGLSDGLKRFDIANLPVFGVFSHSFTHIFLILSFPRLMALDQDPGEVLLSSTPALASSSARLFP